MFPYRVLNTRPAHQAIALTQAIKSHTGAVYELPLFDIQSLPFEVPNINALDYLIFVSANAVNAFFKKYPVEIKTASVIAVGSATADALKNHGVKKVLLPKEFNSEAILAMPALQYVAHKKIAIICGENSKSLLFETLKSRGALVQETVCYRRQRIAYHVDEVMQSLISFDVNCVVITSMESYLALMELFVEIKAQSWLLTKTICVIHDKMKQQAVADGFMRVLQAENATTEAIVKTLMNAKQ